MTDRLPMPTVNTWVGVGTDIISTAPIESRSGALTPSGVVTRRRRSGDMATVSHSCDHCGTLILVPSSRSALKHHFCNKTCYLNFKASNRTIGTCSQCGKEFPYSKSRLRHADQRLFCSSACRRFRALGFWERVDQSGGPASCWEWTGPKHPAGYGIVERLTDDGHFRRAHRFAWYLANGPIPDGMYICHACDNPSCCNPAHLFLGTPVENVVDREQKGRGGRLSGTRHPNAKLSDNDVRIIRRMYAEGCATPEIARQFGISREHAWSVATRRDRQTVLDVNEDAVREGRIDVLSRAVFDGTESPR